MTGFFVIAIILFVIALGISWIAGVVSLDSNAGARDVLSMIVATICLGLGLICFHHATVTEANCWAANKGYVISGECVTLTPVDSK